MSIAVGWLLSVSLSVSDVLFMLVSRAVAVGWQSENFVCKLHTHCYQGVRQQHC